jgi:integrase
VEPMPTSVTVASASLGRSRTRGEVEALPSGSLRVRVYAGIDPVSRKRHYLVETVGAGPSAARDAERVRTRLLNQVDERRNPRTKATVNQLLDRWLEVVELETDHPQQRGWEAEQACAAGVGRSVGEPARC